jgi:hypothetical protein
MYVQPYACSALCLFSLMLVQPYVRSALCTFSLMYVQPYVRSALCMFSLMTFLAWADPTVPGPPDVWQDQGAWQGQDFTTTFYILLHCTKLKIQSSYTPHPPIKNFYSTCPMFYTLRQKIPAKGLTGKRRDERKERELAFTRTSTVNY